MAMVAAPETAGQGAAAGRPTATIKREFIVERDGRSFVLYAGLLDAAHGQGLSSVATALVQIPTQENGMVAICRAVVVTALGTFAGIGDASPANVTAPMRNAIIRMAETRAKARALRDATNVGMAALEEMGDGADVEEDDRPGGRSAPGAARRKAEKGERRAAEAEHAPPELREQDERLRAVAARRGRPVEELERWAAAHCHARSWDAIRSADRERVLALLDQGDAAVLAGAGTP